MVINATAYYQEDDKEQVQCRIKATVHIESESSASDDLARAMARNMYQNMLMSIPNGRSVKSNVAKQDVHMAK